MLNCTGFTGSNSINRSPDFSIASDETRDEHVKIAEITRRLDEEDSNCEDKESDVSSVLITGKDQSKSKRKDENSDKTQDVNDDDDSNTDKSTAIIPLVRKTITTVNSETVTPVSQEKLCKETKLKESGSTKDSQETMFLTLNTEQRYMTNKSSMKLLLAINACVL